MLSRATTMSLPLPPEAIHVTLRHAFLHGYPTLTSSLEGTRLVASRSVLAHHFGLTIDSVCGHSAFPLVVDGDYLWLNAIPSLTRSIVLTIDGVSADDRPTGKSRQEKADPVLLDPTDVNHIAGWSSKDRERYDYLVHRTLPARLQASTRDARNFRNKTSVRYKVEDGELWVAVEQSVRFHNFGRHSHRSDHSRLRLAKSTICVVTKGGLWSSNGVLPYIICGGLRRQPIQGDHAGFHTRTLDLLRHEPEQNYTHHPTRRSGQD